MTQYITDYFKENNYSLKKKTVEIHNNNEIEYIKKYIQNSERTEIIKIIINPDDDIHDENCELIDYFVNTNNIKYISYERDHHLYFITEYEIYLPIRFKKEFNKMKKKLIKSKTIQ